MQALGVELADWERADTALRASRAADEPRTGALDGVGESGVNDLDQARICWWKHTMILLSIGHKKKTRRSENKKEAKSGCVLVICQGGTRT